MTDIVQLNITGHPEVTAALGRLTMAHTGLELVLRYTVKTLAYLTINEALDATRGERTSDTRNRIRKLFNQHKPTQIDKTKLESLLGKAARLSSSRNTFLHSAWAQSGTGSLLFKREQDNHDWGSAPTNAEIDRVTKEIQQLILEINKARLDGFIKEVADKSELNPENKP